MKTAGLLLAGGRGSRMGPRLPKPLLDVAGRTMASRSLDRLNARLDPILISTNDPAAYAHLGREMVVDRIAGHAGPLAGLDAAAAHLRALDNKVCAILSVPGDTPFLPWDLVPRLLDAADGDTIVVAAFAGRLHPATTLWPSSSLVELEIHLAQPDAPRSLLAWILRFPHRTVEFPASADAPDGDPFFNVNTPADLDRAVRHAKSVE